jgi:hypothetical protein
MVRNIVALYKGSLVYYSCAKTADRTYLLILTRYSGDPRAMPPSVVDLHYKMGEGWMGSAQNQELLNDLGEAVFSGGS